MTDDPSKAAQTPPTLRPFQNADAPAVARLITDSMRGKWTYRPEQFRTSADPQRVRVVAERGGEVVATANLTPFGAGAPDALRLDLAGDPGAFTPLYLHLLTHLPDGFTRLLGVTREDFTEQMDFFHAAGFRNAWQSWGAGLDLTAFDFSPFQPLEERLFLLGYEVERLTSDAPGADWAAFHTLHERAQSDVPRNPTTTLEAQSRADLHAMIRREEAAFVVRWRGETVALTRLTLGGRKGQGRTVESEFTATDPAHGSRGLGTLVKARALAWAKAQGYTHAGTGGTVLNLPMLRVNARLGYVTSRLWVTWERFL